MKTIYEVTKSIKPFLILNCFVFGTLGAIVGSVLDMFIHYEYTVFLCGAYSALLIGFLGGFIFLFNHNLA